MLLDGLVEFELSELLLEVELEDGLVLVWFELYVPPAVVEVLLDGEVLFELRELLVEDVEDGLLVLAVLFVELYGLDDVAAEFELVEFWLLVAAEVLVLFDVSEEAVVEGLV